MSHEIDLTELADFEGVSVDGDMILEWAQDKGKDGGGLPGVSALAFSDWLNSSWNDYDDGSGTQTNGDILRGALDFWTGR